MLAVDYLNSHTNSTLGAVDMRFRIHLDDIHQLTGHLPIHYLHLILKHTACSYINQILISHEKYHKKKQNI